MRDHELRLRVVGEMHLRRWPLITAPCHVIQWVLNVDDDERAQELIAIEAQSGKDGLVGNPSHREGQINPGVSFTWERQSEGSSLTLFAHGGTESGYLDPTTDPEQHHRQDTNVVASSTSIPVSQVTPWVMLRT